MSNCRALTIILYFVAVVALHRTHPMRQQFHVAAVAQIVIQLTEMLT